MFLVLRYLNIFFSCAYALSDTFWEKLKSAAEKKVCYATPAIYLITTGAADIAICRF